MLLFRDLLAQLLNFWKLNIFPSPCKRGGNPNNRERTKTSRASKNCCANKYNIVKQRKFVFNRFLIGQTNEPSLPNSEQPLDRNLIMHERPQRHNSNVPSILTINETEKMIKLVAVDRCAPERGSLMANLHCIGSPSKSIVLSPASFACTPDSRSKYLLLFFRSMLLLDGNFGNQLNLSPGLDRHR